MLNFILAVLIRGEDDKCRNNSCNGVFKKEKRYLLSEYYQEMEIQPLNLPNYHQMN